MRALIVDDEVYAVEAIQEMIGWESLGIDEVVPAYSMQQAQKVLQDKPCEILVCDIEMPRGSGLELLSWMRDQGMDTVAIFLTSHANFNYANRAIKLDTFDYVLKPADPAELQQVLARAVEKVKENEARNRRLEEAGYWDDSEVQRLEDFLLRVADGRVPPRREEISHQAKMLHLEGVDMSGQFHPLLVQLRAETTDEKEWGKGLVEYGLKNILSETLFPDVRERGRLPLIPQIAPRYYITFVRADKMDWGGFLALCQQALAACLSAMPCAVTFYPGEAAPVERFSEKTEALLKLASDNILYDNTVYLPPPAETLQMEEESWQKALDEGANPDELGALLDRAARGGLLTRTYLRRMFDRTQDYIVRQFSTRTPDGGGYFGYRTVTGDRFAGRDEGLAFPGAGPHPGTGTGRTAGYPRCRRNPPPVYPRPSKRRTRPDRTGPAGLSKPRLPFPHLPGAGRDAAGGFYHRRADEEGAGTAPFDRPADPGCGAGGRLCQYFLFFPPV